METSQVQPRYDVQVGSLRIPEGLGLAPMAGATNLPFRLLCRCFGAGLTVTEMVSAKALVMGSGKTMHFLERDPLESPVGAQVFGTDPVLMAEAARIVEERGFHLVDVNMGCPVPKIAGDGAGCALMREPGRAAAIIEAMARAVRIPVTVKVRKGWSEETVNAPRLARILEGAGAAAVTVHGRTAEQKYSGHADWALIGEVKASVGIPVFGNGDIDSPEKAERCLRASGCDGLMIGRGALSAPWIFRDIRSLRSGASCPPPLSRDELGRLVLDLAEGLMRLYGERTAVLMMRRYGSDFSRGLPGGSFFRQKLMQKASYGELEELVRRYFRAEGSPAPSSG